METKLSKVKAAAESGDWETAIKLASKFPRLGAHEKSIRLAAECIKHPAFYRQLKRDIAATIEAGKEALRDKYKIA